MLRVGKGLTMYNAEDEEFLKGVGGVGEEVIEEYRLDGFTKVRVVKDVAGDIKYVVDAPEPSEEDEVVIEAVRRWFIEEYPTSDLVPEKMAIVLEGITARLARKFLRKKFRNGVPKDVISRLQYIVKRDIIGFGKLDPLLKDPNIEDVHILGIGRPVYVWHTRYENIPTNIYFIDPTDLDRHLQKLMILSGKFVSLSRPIIDGTLPMGYRVHVVHKVISELGTTITIRKYREVPFTIVDLVKLGTIFPELVGLLWVAMENKRSVFIVGETASGKTTLLNAIASLIPLNMKVVTVEEVREIRLPHPNVVYMTTREGTEITGNVTLYDLIKASMRQRPDYIVVGEIRGEEAYVLLQAISLGHGGLCLPKDQLVPMIVDGCLDLYRVGDVVEGVLTGKIRSVKVLTHNNGKPVWADVRRVYVKTGSNRFVKITSVGGVVHEVHEEHPVVVYDNGKLRIKKAKELREGDTIVSLADLPIPFSYTNKALDIMQILEDEKEDLYVYGIEGIEKLRPATITKELGVNYYRAYEWVKKGVAIPLVYVEKLVEKGLLDRKAVEKAYIAYGAKGRNGVRIVVPLNYEFGYVLGMFLADGTVHYGKDGLPRRVVLYVGTKLELLDKVVKALERIVDRRAIRVDKRGCYAVRIESKVFAMLIHRLLDGKVTHYDRSVPLHLALSAPKEFRKGIVAGFWDGDGSVFVRDGMYVVAEAQVSNRRFAESIALLLRSLGVVASVREVDNSRGVGRRKKNAYLIWILGGASKECFLKIAGYDCTIIKTYTKVRRVGNLLLHPIVKIEVVEKNSLLYDLEVENESHVYAISGGLILTHNSTMHAEGPVSAVKRLMAPPMNIPPYLVKLLDIIIHITKVRLKSGIRRYVLTAAEIADINLDTKEPTLNYIYRIVIDEESGAKLSKFLPEESLTLRKISEIKGLTRESLIRKVRARTEFIAGLSGRELGYEEVMREITNYRD